MKLTQFAGLWTLAHHPSRERDWTLERKLRTIKACGFGGVCARLDIAIASLARANGLFAIGLIFPDDPAEFHQLLRTQKEFGAIHVSVQLGSHATSPVDAVRKWIRLENEAEKLGLIISLETHRDSATETPDKLFEVADRYEKQTRRTIQLTWDFSHFGVVKHLPTGQLVERLLIRPDLIQNATQFLFRPFNRHHAQLPVSNKGDLTPEVIDYLGFAQEVMRVWKSSSRNEDREMLACPSLGPKSGYALSNFPAVWPDALRLSEQLTKRWQKAG